MFIPSEIKTCFDQLVGWRNSAKSPTCFPDLTTELQNSISGFYLDSVEGLQLSVIEEAIGGDNIDLNVYLQNSHEDSAIKLINSFIQLQKEKLTTKALLSSLNVGVRIGNIRETVTPRSRFVGFEIRPKESSNLKVELSHLGVQFNAAQVSNALDIYFYSSSDLQPVQVFSITPTKDSSIEWLELTNFIAGYISDNQGSGADYYIGYYEDELVGQAVQTQMGCKTCSNSPYKKWRDYFSLNPIEVQANHTYLSRELFDVESMGRSENTYGLHLKVNATCDITDVICQNKSMFAAALQKQIAIKIFWDIYNSEKINRMTVLNKADSRLNAERLELALEDELQTLSMDFSNIDPICQNCKRKSFGRINLR
jgi:hypothetical protein